MDDTTKYIIGTVGFKSALMSHFGAEWTNGTRDIGQDILSFTLTENSSIEAMKDSIGDDVLAEYDINFFDELPMRNPPYTQLKRVPPQAFKMSIWVNRDSNVKGNGSTKSEGGMKLA
jgi:hypothetical protein